MKKKRKLGLGEWWENLTTMQVDMSLDGDPTNNQPKDVKDKLRGEISNILKKNMKIY